MQTKLLSVSVLFCKATTVQQYLVIPPHPNPTIVVCCYGKRSSFLILCPLNSHSPSGNINERFSLVNSTHEFNHNGMVCPCYVVKLKSFCEFDIVVILLQLIWFNIPITIMSFVLETGWKGDGGSQVMLNMRQMPLHTLRRYPCFYFVLLCTSDVKNTIQTASFR